MRRHSNRAIQIASRVKKRIPPRLLNSTLLRFPALYRLGLVNYESNLDAAAVEVLLDELERAFDLPGDIVECGVSRGGGSVLMARRVRRAGVAKKIYACDSFEGFDRAELARERSAGLSASSDDAFTSTSLDYVRAKLRALDLDDIVVPVPGYFQDTLAALDVEPAFAFVDCDLRDSVVYCAETLWPRLPPGGRMVFDDYLAGEFPGARLGIDAFVADHRAEIAGHGLRGSLYCVQKIAATAGVATDARTVEDAPGPTP
ncbi:MAG: O-methyltransferase [Actinomycetota bacterium]|nr:O-methyltransferase [Actinomycetota bacterium]